MDSLFVSSLEVRLFKQLARRLTPQIIILNGQFYSFVLFKAELVAETGLVLHL